MAHLGYHIVQRPLVHILMKADALRSKWLIMVLALLWDRLIQVQTVPGTNLKYESCHNATTPTISWHIVHASRQGYCNGNHWRSPCFGHGTSFRLTRDRQKGRHHTCQRGAWSSPFWSLCGWFLNVSFFRLTDRCHSRIKLMVKAIGSGKPKKVHLINNFKRNQTRASRKIKERKLLTDLKGSVY